MKLRHQRDVGQKKPLKKIIAVVGTLLVAGAIGCATARSPPRNTKTRCWSFGVPPQNPEMDENLDPMMKQEKNRPGPMGSYIRCITIEEPPMPGDNKPDGGPQ